MYKIPIQQLCQKHGKPAKGVVQLWLAIRRFGKKMSFRKFGFRRYDQKRPESFELSSQDTQSRKSSSPGPIEKLFYDGNGRLVHKWVHYLPVYDRLFAPYQNKSIKMLEIGVSQGGSLKLWRDYFGSDATILGIDIDPDCATKVDLPNQVRIGSQADPAFLDSVIDEMGTPDIILDDGSHVAEHQVASFKHLFPKLAEGGLYVIEDVHTSYWARNFNGGYQRPGTAIEMIKSLIDDMHGWYHSRGEHFVAKGEVGALMIFDSIIAVEKRASPKPGHFKVT